MDYPYGCLTLELCRQRPWPRVLKERARYVLFSGETDLAEAMTAAISLWRGVSFLLPGDVFTASPSYAWFRSAGITDTPFGLFFLLLGVLKCAALILDHRDGRKLLGSFGVFGWSVIGASILVTDFWGLMAYWGWAFLFAAFNFMFAVRVRRWKG